MPRREPLPVDRIRQLLAQGLTQTQVAKRLGLTKGTVWRVAHGKETTTR